jgi:hypothetical protein
MIKKLFYNQNTLPHVSVGATTTTTIIIIIIRKGSPDDIKHSVIYSCVSRHAPAGTNTWQYTPVQHRRAILLQLCKFHCHSSVAVILTVAGTMASI